MKETKGGGEEEEGTVKDSGEGSTEAVIQLDNVTSCYQEKTGEGDDCMLELKRELCCSALGKDVSVILLAFSWRLSLVTGMSQVHKCGVVVKGG